MIQTPDEVLIDILILLHSSKTLLQHPVKSKPHPLANELNLLACMISGKTQEQQSFQQRTLGSSSRIGIPRQPKDMTTTLGNGKCFVVEGVLIPFYTQHCWVFISRHSKISPAICYHYGQWDILWKTSPCSAFYEKHIQLKAGPSQAICSM